jgi:steroid delta-isomerase-like uncharacterized protein
MPADPVAQFYAVYHDGSVERLSQILAPSYVGQVNGREIAGVEAAKEFLGAFLRAFPDTRYTLHATLESGACVVTRWTATATHRGLFAGFEPTNRPVAMTGITIFSVRDGLIEALWNNWDLCGLLQQLQG